MLKTTHFLLVCTVTILLALALIYCGGSDRPITPVNPLLAADLCVSEEYCIVSAEGDSSTVIEITNCGNSAVFEWSASDTCDWFSLSVESDSTPGSFTVTADTNRTAAQRTGAITVWADSLDDRPKTVTVIQPVMGTEMCLSADSFSLAGEGEISDTIFVLNCGNATALPWSAGSDSSWLTASPWYGWAPDGFVIVADNNRSGAERTGTILVTANDMSGAMAEVTVWQPSREPTLGVSVEQWEAPPLGGESDAISVENCGDMSSFGWAVTKDADWLTLSESSGSTPGTFTISADTNSTEAPRTGTVTITADGIIDSPWEIAVSQHYPLMLLASIYDASGYTCSVCLSGNYAYLANGYGGLQIVDVSDPYAPVTAGNCTTPDNARGVVRSGDYAYVADYDSGLYIIDVTNVSSPAFVGGYDTPGGCLAVFVSGNYAFMADWGSGVQIIDVSNPAVPAFEANFETAGYARDIHVSGDYAYVAAYSAGLQILDVSDRSDPLLAGSCATTGYARGVFVSGDYAYVADGSGGLQVIDVSVPSSPTLTGTVDIPAEATDVFVSGNFAYVTDTNGGVSVIDVSDPGAPVSLGRFNTHGYPHQVVVDGDYAYLANDSFGLYILKLGPDLTQ